MPWRGAWSSGSDGASRPQSTPEHAERERASRSPNGLNAWPQARNGESPPRHPGPPAARRQSVAPGVVLASQGAAHGWPSLFSAASLFSARPAGDRGHRLGRPLRHGGGHGSAGQAPVPRFFPRSLRRTLTACAEWRGDRARRLAIVPRMARHPESTALTCHRTPPSISSLWHDPSGRWLKRAARTVRGVLESMV